MPATIEITKSTMIPITRIFFVDGFIDAFSLQSSNAVLTYVVVYCLSFWVGGKYLLKIVCLLSKEEHF